MTTSTNGSNGTGAASADNAMLGMHTAEPVEGALTTTAGGKTQYSTIFRITDGPAAGRHITWWGGFEGGGFRYTTEALATMGWDKQQSLTDFKPKGPVKIFVARRTIPAKDGKPAKDVVEVKYINPMEGKGGGAPSLGKNAMNRTDAQRASDAIMARLRALQGGDAAGGSAEEAPNSFDPGPDSGADEDAPF